MNGKKPERTISGSMYGRGVTSTFTGVFRAYCGRESTRAGGGTAKALNERS